MNRIFWRCLRRHHQLGDEEQGFNRPSVYTKPFRQLYYLHLRKKKTGQPRTYTINAIIQREPCFLRLKPIYLKQTDLLPGFLGLNSCLSLTLPIKALLFAPPDVHRPPLLLYSCDVLSSKLLLLRLRFQFPDTLGQTMATMN